MKTRARNKGQHPGVPDVPKPRRSHTEMEKIRQEKAEKQQAEQEAKKQAIEKVASLEDALREEDISRQAERRAGAKRKAEATAQAHLTGDQPSDLGSVSDEPLQQRKGKLNTLGRHLPVLPEVITKKRRALASDPEGPELNGEDREPMRKSKRSF